MRPRRSHDAVRGTRRAQPGPRGAHRGQARRRDRPLTQALSKDPTNKFALFNLGQIEHTKNHLVAAEAWYRLALESDKAMPSALYNLALVRQTVGDSIESASLLRTSDHGRSEQRLRALQPGYRAPFARPERRCDDRVRDGAASRLPPRGTHRLAGAAFAHTLILSRLRAADRSHVVLWLIVLSVVAFNAIYLFPEIVVRVPSNNDDAFQFLYVQRASDALARGDNPFDFWVPQLELGFATFVHYQNLPHLAVVGIHRLLFGLVDLLTLFNLVRWLLLVTFPLTVLWSLRRMGFSLAQSALAGAAASLLSTPFLYGFDYGSYIWRGFGMYTQLWAMHLAFIGLAATTR